jgi:CheY-like chemotaxis protein
MKVSLLFLRTMVSEYILIAEDDEDDRLLLMSAFRDISSKKKLVFVENGIELVDHFGMYDKGVTRELPALLIVDLNMPRKNGREALSELVYRDYFRHIPTVIFSTTGNEIDRSRCHELGITGYFVKPSNYVNLLEVVRKFDELAETSIRS